MDKKYAAREDVVFTVLDDGTGVLLHLQTKYYFSLNETGAFLWKVLEKKGGASKEELATALLEEYDVDPERALKDVDQFIKELLKEKLLED